MKQVLMAIAALSAMVSFSAGLPQVAIVPWTDSLHIVDEKGNDVILDNARIIDSLVDGVVPPHDSVYNKRRLELIARFDKPISANTVTMWGQIYANGYDFIWMIIEGITGEKTRKVWKPIHIPALRANQEVTLVRTMLGSDFNVYYDDTRLIEPYGLSFVEWIQKFYCGIQFLNKENMGITCTIDCVLIDDNTSTRDKLSSFSYKYTDGKYEDMSDSKWFNARVGWYEEIPRDFKQCINCTVTDVEDSMAVKEFGKVAIDDRVDVNVLTNLMNSRNFYTKKLNACILGGKDLVCQSFDNVKRSLETSYENAYTATAACALYTDDNITTNLMGLVRNGSSNEFVRLSSTSDVDLTKDVKFTMTINKYYRETCVSYQVNDVYFTHNGKREIPVRNYGERDVLSMSGSAIVTDIYGDYSGVGGSDVLVK